MKIITCIKQVPGSTQVEIDPITGNLVRDGKNAKMNPYDLFALEAAFEIKERTNNCEVHALTMGPFSATDVLRNAIYMGADKGSLVTDRRFAGADVLATAYTLSQTIQRIGHYDLIICGKQTTDGDTAQVGPEIAEFLGIPHVPYVKEIVEIKEHSIIVTSAYDFYDEKIEVEFPCLITVEKDSNVPRLPSYRRKRKYQELKLDILSLKDFDDQDPGNYGLSGSPTQVEEIFPPQKTKDSIRIEGSGKELGEAIYQILKENRYV